MNYKMEIAYDGSRYKGWQRLGNNPNTIQGKIETVLTEFAGKKVEIHGSGRTDAGVHATAQIASFELRQEADPYELKTYLNRYLPDDIAVMQVVITDDRFHARYQAKGKVYRYQIYQSDVMDPFLRKYFLYVNGELNLGKMRKAADHFLGEHDFSAYTTAKSKKKSFVRTIERITFYEEGPKVFIEIEGNGFLHNMVRMMMGSLLEVGIGKMKPGQIQTLLTTKNRAETGPIAPAQGLFLKEVIY